MTFTGTSPEFRQAWGFHLRLGLEYDSAVSGPIDAIDYSEDALCFAGEGDGQGTGPALLQRGKVYVQEGVTGLPQTWTRLTRTDLASQAFVQLHGGSPFLINDSHPDFSTAGGPIRFGFWRGNSSKGSYRSDIGIDNWSVTVKQRRATFVRLLAPADGSVFRAPANIEIVAEPVTCEGAITNVEFFAGSTSLGTATNTPFSLVWQNAPVGGFLLTARATNSRGLSSTSAPVRITVEGECLPPPWLTPLLDQVILEDTSGLASFAIGDPCGPVSQLRVTASSWNPALIPQPNLVLGGTDTNRTLTIRPAPDQFSRAGFGEGWVLVTVADQTQTVGTLFKVTVLPVNDPPSFLKGGDPVVDEDAGATVVADWASQITAGPPNEANQALQFNVLSNSHEPLFATLPSITPDGTLRFTPAPNASGTALLTLVLKDDGGRANGGVDTSSAQSFSITVSPVNDPPAAGADAVGGTEDQLLTVPVATLLANDSPGPAEESSQELTVMVGVATSQQGGLLRFEGANVVYLPPTNFFGTDAFAYTVTDNGTSRGRPDPKSATGVVTITVVGVNDPPVLSLPTNRFEIGPGTLLRFTATASDPEVPPQKLTFSLVPGAPDGATIDPTSGVFSWTPSVARAGTSLLTAVVTDNGQPPLSDRRDFTVVVTSTNTRPSLQIVKPTDGFVFSTPAHSFANIEIQAELEDPQREVTRVDFYAGDEWIGHAISAPWVHEWLDVRRGGYRLWAQGLNVRGQVLVVASPVRVMVGPLCSNVAIISAAQGQDLQAMRDDMFAVGIPPRVVDPASITPQTRTNWFELIRVELTGATLPPGIVRMDLNHQVPNPSGLSRVTDFYHDLPLPEAVWLPSDADTVIAWVETAPVAIARRHLQLGCTSRIVTQLFRVSEGGTKPRSWSGGSCLSTRSSGCCRASGVRTPRWPQAAGQRRN